MNTRRSRATCDRAAFTLIELLVVIAIVAVLAAILLPVLSKAKQQGNVVATLSNMKQMGAAMLLYAGDNNFLLPNRVQNASNPGATPDKWPTALKPYIQDTRVYSSPIPDAQGKSYKVTDPTQYFNNSANYTSYIYNGMNDIGAFTDPTVAPRLNVISIPSETILLGIPYPQKLQFYMDFVEGGGNNNDILNKAAFPNGSVYVFCDGSSRILVNNQDSTTYQKQRPPNSGTYTDWLWLMDKTNTGVIQ